MEKMTVYVENHKNIRNGVELMNEFGKNQHARSMY